MIIVKLYGGLGNQMFQYALGRSLAHHYNVALALDTTAFTAAVGDPKLGIRTFALNNFNITTPLASAADLRPYSSPAAKVAKHLWRAYDQGASYHKRSYVWEPESQHYRFDERLFNRSRRDNFYCHGFFQTEKYFSGIADTLRQEFTVRHEPDAQNTNLLAKMATQNSVALHIRHGDNANAVAKAHGVLALEYYAAALTQLGAVVPDLQVYVFSDDADWAKANLKSDYPLIFVNHNGDAKNYEDIRLMSACKHHIVGNSTFSWWGAWLGKKPGQRVFAPKYYHVGKDISGTDFYPVGWTIL